MSKPRITKELHMHLNGGSKFSQLSCRVLVDGKDTGIYHVTRTSGAPEYLVTENYLAKGGDVLDLKAKGATNADAYAWILARAIPAEREL